MQQTRSTSSSSADFPFPNIFNTHCEICSHPIAHSDINVLQPCCCGPFHNYCITNLELQAREANPKNLSPRLSCPRCHQTVTSVAFDLVNHTPRSNRPPFTNSFTTSARPAPASSPISCPQRLQPTSQPLLPTAIHDIRSRSPLDRSDNPPWSPYPKPTTPPIMPQYSPTHIPQNAFSIFHESASYPPYPTYRPQPAPPPPPPPPPPPTVPESSLHYSSYPHHTIPTAPLVSQDEHILPHDIDDCFPPPSPDFKPHPSKTTHKSSAQATRRRHVSNLAAESRTKCLADRLDLPSPYDGVPPSPVAHKARRRPQSHYNQRAHSKTSSPNIVVIRKLVSEEDVRKGLYGDDVYKAYVEGTAKLLRESPYDGKRKAGGKNMKVKVEMDVHVFHHHKPHSASSDCMNDRKSAKDRERKKGKPADKSWWKSPRAVSLLDARERRHRDGRPNVRRSPTYL